MDPSRRGGGLRRWGPIAALVLGAGLAIAALSAQTGARADTAPLTHAPDGRALVLTFSEDFDRTQPAPPGMWGGDHIWRTTFGAGASTDLSSRTIKTNKEVELYVDPSLKASSGQPLGLNPFHEHDGVLDIVANRADPSLQPAIGGYRFTSGLITSQPSFSQLYGYFEARVKLVSGKGLWPAIWLLPADGSWPPEIDVMESIGDPMTAFMTVHSATDKTPGVEVHPSSDGYHSYAVSWDSQHVVFYLDGVETQRWPTPADMHKPMYVLANLAMGGDWAGVPDASTRFPAHFSIDHIRVYRFSP